MKEYIINGKSFKFNLLENLTNADYYLLGYLSGDGAIQQNGTRTARLGVSSINEKIIVWIKENFTPNTPIKKIIPVNKTRNIKTNKYSYCLMFSTKFSKVFDKYQILSVKKERKCVNIPKKSMKYYLSGLIDADGTFSFGYRKDRNRLWCNFQITHQSPTLLSTIQNFLTNELNIASSLNKRKDEDCWDLKTSHRDNIIKLIDWLYNDNNTPCVKKTIAFQFKEKYV